MGSVRLKALVCLASSFWIACEEYSPELLLGTWRASTVIEEGDTLDLDLSNVKLAFNESTDFIYKHTQRDSMIGKFKLEGALINVFVGAPQQDTIIIQVSQLDKEMLVVRPNSIASSSCTFLIDL